METRQVNHPFDESRHDHYSQRMSKGGVPEELREREKELACIYHLSRVLTSLQPQDEAAVIVARAVRQALTKPESASVRVRLGDTETVDRDDDGMERIHSDAGTAHCIPVTTPAGQIGELCVSYPDLWAPPILDHERELLRAVAALLADNSERRRVVEELRAVAAAESRKTVALEEVLTQLEELRRRNMADMRDTLDSEVLPLVVQLEEVLRDDREKAILNRLRDVLLRLGHDDFARREAHRRTMRASLSPREYEIARMISSGIPTKQIAETLHLAPGTVERHRHSIRRKLGISNHRINLATFLRNDREI
ncbi:MAG: hypothetical protein EA427_01815 [Spirochaetaceae bacterium]|nr:MAG: hypothetical protein EA427_01815 [Spirochaetaceae bacterium]